jgi:hypothetical protein
VPFNRAIAVELSFFQSWFVQLGTQIGHLFAQTAYGFSKTQTDASTTVSVSGGSSNVRVLTIGARIT